MSNAIENIIVTTAPAEPEEVIEAAIVSFLKANCTIPVRGVLSPSDDEGEERTCADETHIAVAVDQSSQDMDTRGHAVPHTYDVNIAVRFAMCDDKSGTALRDECRTVRAVLASLTGDGCSAIDSDEFACDAFVMGRTSTTFEDGDNPVHIKAYSATLKGRVINRTTTTEGI